MVNTIFALGEAVLAIVGVRSEGRAFLRFVGLAVTLLVLAFVTLAAPFLADPARSSTPGISQAVDRVSDLVHGCLSLRDREGAAVDGHLRSLGAKQGGALVRRRGTSGDPGRAGAARSDGGDGDPGVTPAGCPGCSRAGGPLSYNVANPRRRTTLAEEAPCGPSRGARPRARR